MAAAAAGRSSRIWQWRRRAPTRRRPSCRRRRDGAEIAVGNVGDSRVYWLPEPPAPAQCLTVDDSLAQELISAGVPAESEAVQAGAHTLTRWLGADAEPTPWSDSSVRPITTAEPRRAGDVHRRPVELPSRGRRHRAVLHRKGRRRGGARTRRLRVGAPAATTTSPSSVIPIGGPP